jgi:hypothetical protein
MHLFLKWLKKEIISHGFTDKKYTNEHPKYTMFDKYKADKESLTKNYKADISEMDINASKMKGYSSVI